MSFSESGPQTMSWLRDILMEFRCTPLQCSAPPTGPTHLSCLDVPDVDTLILVKGDGLALGGYLNLHRGHIFQWPPDHPAVTRQSLSSLYSNSKHQMTSHTITHCTVYNWQISWKNTDFCTLIWSHLNILKFLFDQWQVRAPFWWCNGYFLSLAHPKFQCSQNCQVTFKAVYILYSLYQESHMLSHETL